MAPASNTDTSVVLTWEKPEHYSNISGYNIYLGGVLVATTNMTYYKITGLSPSATYDFTVKAVGSDGAVLSSPSNQLEVTTTATPKRYNVKDYGATGDGTTKDTVALQKTIDACKEKNCEVYLPAGVYLSGALNLHSDMTFYVDANAQLKPSAELKDYPFTSARHDIEDIYGKNPAYSSLLNAGTMDKTKDVTTKNIKIMGPGTIGDSDNGLLLRKAYDDFTNNGNGGNLDIPGNIYQPNEHVGGGSLISLKNCGSVYMDSSHIRNGMMWTIVPVYSKDITVYGLDIVTSVHNGDGFDPNSTSNVWTLATQFSTGDDNSAIKSGKDAEGIAIGRPSDHLYYRGDVFNSGHGGVTLGSEMSGGISDVFVEDSTLVPVDLTSGAVNPGIRVKVSPKRGAYIRNIQVRDSVVNKISVITNYDRTNASELTPGLTLPDIENFRFSNLTAPNWDNNNGKGNTIDISGSNFGSGLVKYLKNFQFDNCKFHAALLDTTQNIAFRNTKLTDGLSSTRSINVTQDGVVDRDHSFPVNDDFENVTDGKLPQYWKMQKSDTGAGATIKEEPGNKYVQLKDNGPGYETLDRTFTTQKEKVHAEFAFRLPEISAMNNNAVIDWQDVSAAKNLADFKIKGNGDELHMGTTSGEETILSGIQANQWYTVAVDANIPEKKMTVSVDGNPVLTDHAFSESKAAGIGMFEAHMANNNTAPVAMDVDNVKVTAQLVSAKKQITSIVPSAPANSITTKDGTLQLSAAVEANDASVDKSIEWTVTRPDMASTDIATIDQNGLLTAKANGTVLAVATAKDGSGTLGVFPVVITGQQSVSGLVPVSVTTTVGVAPVLPNYVYERNSDGTVMPVAVSWGSVKQSDYAKAGQFTVKGTVKDVGSVDATVTVTEVGVKSLDTAIVKTTPGKLKMPLTVVAQFNDGSSQRVSVKWDKVDAAQYANKNLDGFTVSGTVAGVSQKAKAVVMVLPEVVAGVTPIVVSADGNGDFRTMGEAIASIPQNNKQRRVIFVKRGTYKEKLSIDRPYLTVVGESPDSTRLTYDAKPSDIGKDGNPLGTYHDYSVKITGNDFSAKDITFETTAGSTVGQAVALDVRADHASFDNCHILGYQDTLLLRNKTDASVTDNVPDQPTVQTYRSYFKNCYISGSVDWVFGAAEAVFDKCTMHAMLNGYATAASTPQAQKYGFVFRDSVVTGENPYSGALQTYLGRPWRPYAAVAYVNTKMDRNVPAIGWHDWGKPANQSTARYYECNSSGDGYNAAGRATWVKTCNASDFTVDKVFAKTSGINAADDWDPTQLVNPPAADAVPEAVDATAETMQGIAYTGDLSAYAQADGVDSLKFEVVNRPAHGVLTLQENGAYSYLPDPSFAGADTFTFKAINGSAVSNEAKVSINVRSVTADLNAAPVKTIKGTEQGDGVSATLTQSDFSGISDSAGNILFDLGNTQVKIPFEFARMLAGYGNGLKVSALSVSDADQKAVDKALGKDAKVLADRNLIIETVDSQGKTTSVSNLPGMISVSLDFLSPRDAGETGPDTAVYRFVDGMLTQLEGAVDMTSGSANMRTDRTGIMIAEQSLTENAGSDTPGNPGAPNNGNPAPGAPGAPGAPVTSGNRTSAPNASGNQKSRKGGQLTATGSAVLGVGIVVVMLLVAGIAVTVVVRGKQNSAD